MIGGSMVERAPGKDGLRRWQLFADAPPGPDGRRRRISTVYRGSSKKAAAQALLEHIAAVRAAHPTTVAPSSTMPLADWTDRWLEHLTTAGRSPTTIAAYRRRIAHDITPTLGTTQLGQLRPADLRALYAQLTTGGAAATSVRQVHAILRRCLADAVLDELIADNPATKVRPPSLPQHEIVPPTNDDVRRLLEHADQHDPHISLWLRLHASTGARRGEICALRWRDIDLDRGTVIIRRSTAVLAGTGPVELPTKTRSVRTVPIPDELAARLRARWATVEAFAHACDATASADWWVLPMGGAPDHERPFPPDSASQYFARLRAELDLRHVRLHDLRHWWVTHLLAEGLDLASVAHLAGHASTATTSRVYAHHTAAGIHRARSIIGAAIGEKLHSL